MIKTRVQALYHQHIQYPFSMEVLKNLNESIYELFKFESLFRYANVYLTYACNGEPSVIRTNMRYRICKELLFIEHNKASNYGFSRTTSLINFIPIYKGVVLENLNRFCRFDTLYDTLNIVGGFAYAIHATHEVKLEDNIFLDTFKRILMDSAYVYSSLSEEILKNRVRNSTQEFLNHCVVKFPGLIKNITIITYCNKFIKCINNCYNMNLLEFSPKLD